MRAIVVAALMIAGLASAESPSADPPPTDTVTLTRAQMDDLEKQFEEIVARKMREAYEAGVQYQKQACRSLI